MDRIATSVERDPIYSARVHFTETLPEPTTADALVRAARADRPHRLGARRWSASPARARPRGASRASGRPVPLLVLTAVADDRAAARPAVGRARGPHPRRPQLRGDGRQGQAHGAAPRPRRGPATGSSSWPACRSGRAGSTNVIHVVRLIGDELDRHAGRDELSVEQQGRAPRPAISRARKPTRPTFLREMRPASPCSQTPQSNAVSGVGAARGRPPTIPASTSPLPEMARPGAAALEAEGAAVGRDDEAAAALDQDDALDSARPRANRSRAGRARPPPPSHSSRRAISPAVGQQGGGAAHGLRAARLAGRGAARRRAPARVEHQQARRRRIEHRPAASSGPATIASHAAASVTDLRDRRCGEAAVAVSASRRPAPRARRFRSRRRRCPR